MKKEKRIKAWHFVGEDRRLRYGDGRKVRAGRVYSYTGERPPELCKRGVHASERLLDALEYAPGAILCRVEVWGDVVRDGDKLVARHRKVLWTLDATRILHEFACRYAARALTAAKVTDKRCWNAITVKRAWLAGKATDDELSAAGSAAWDAAGSAAWDAAGSAARSAAGSAAGSAARSAAGSAARDAQNRLLLRMIRQARKK
jgi:hypothetical protein